MASETNKSHILTGSQQYPHVLSDMRDWPVFKLSEDREAFMFQVEEQAINNILNAKRKEPLSREIARVLYMERQRIKENPWKVDPKDDGEFWKDVRKQLLQKSLDPDASEEEVIANNTLILRRIVRRYVNEMTGRFEIGSFRFARNVLTKIFRTMLNAASWRSIRKVLSGERMMEDKVKIIGEIEHVRELASKGTVVLVPTHFSNLDSVLIGWSADRIGLPAFSYGAGLNLYNSSIFAYFMRRLGAYTVDRRKKNPFYLETLKSFSKVAIQRGTNSLFFPGGTRSRSGQLETDLKKGLLGSVIDAQCEHFLNNHDRKIYMVPVVLNYHFTLEAKSLIEQYLSNTGKELYLVEKKPFGGAWKFFRFFWKLFSVSSEIVVSYGKPLDVLGNFVDTNGKSIDRFGNPVELKEYFMYEGELTYDRQRNEQYTHQMAETLVQRYYAENVVLTSHLIAHLAFCIYKKNHPDMDLYGILRLPEEELEIPIDDFRAALQKMINRLLYLTGTERVKLSYPIIHGSLDDIIRHGLENLGLFHAKKVLTMDKDKTVIYTEDINLLYYYHNRLDGYGLIKSL